MTEQQKIVKPLNSYFSGDNVFWLFAVMRGEKGFIVLSNYLMQMAFCPD